MTFESHEQMMQIVTCSDGTTNVCTNTI